MVRMMMRGGQSWVQSLYLECSLFVTILPISLCYFHRVLSVRWCLSRLYCLTLSIHNCRSRWTDFPPISVNFVFSLGTVHVHRQWWFAVSRRSFTSSGRWFTRGGTKWLKRGVPPPLEPTRQSVSIISADDNTVSPDDNAWAWWWRILTIVQILMTAHLDAFVQFCTFSFWQIAPAVTDDLLCNVLLYNLHSN